MTSSGSYEMFASLEDVSVGCVSQSLFQKSIVVNSDSFCKCVICCGEVCFDIVRRLKCGHEFHINCIDRWFTKNKKCPVCRYEI